MQTIKMNKFIYWPFAIIAIVGIFGTLLFSIGYSTIYVGFILNPNGESSYGLFQPAIPGVSKRVSNLIGSIMFFVQFGIFLLMPLINHLLRSKIEKVKIEKEN
ncbi:hypothetical protein MYMA111404_01735 [Mycoplasma marinum]|uniref:Uncharacterized protein n=1 Tax=Mycoplasma marinum TaxID=1937190 RepID=A0A4R0XSL1_9MOLU|nr:hypothetical protein [Mycoplasma marinum]TCG11871.1 hypothetical protein C4B24_00540 [Mycoplasma marinum]